MMDIYLALEKLGMIGNYAPDCSTYETMVATWRDSSVSIPSKSAMQTAYDNGIGAINAMAEIKRLESTVTQRRIRAMTTDAGKKWMEDLEAKIATERGKL